MLKKLLFLSIPVILIALFFCSGNDSKSMQNVQTKPFVPDHTDVMNYTFNFTSRDTDVMRQNIGPSIILKAISPKSLIDFLTTWIPGFSFDREWSVEVAQVDILDARKIPDLSFHDNGFTLIDVGKSEAKDWRNEEDIKTFHNEMEQHIRKLYPDVKDFAWSYSEYRGGNTFGDQSPVINGPHLDFNQNDTAREEFDSTHPIYRGAQNIPYHLLDKNHTLSKYEPKIVLGVWKPINMDTSVCDHPLTIMDGKTFYPSEETLHEVHFNFVFAKFHNLGAGIKYHPDQKWYYYSFQTTEEVLIFTQYTRGKYFANPHTSFNNPNCPEGVDQRMSIETRVVLYFEDSDSKPSSESRITG